MAEKMSDVTSAFSGILKHLSPLELTAFNNSGIAVVCIGHHM